MNIQFLQHQEYAFQRKVPVSGEQKFPISQKPVGLNNTPSYGLLNML